MSPLSPRSDGLRAPGGPQPGKGSSVPQSKKQPRQYSRVAKFLWDSLDFIQANFHIGWLMTASVNTEAERENIKELYSNRESTSSHISVSP
jgi:hypothetical protein